MTRLVVVSAGLSNPSSTRLLADRLTDAALVQLPGAEVTHVELRDLAHLIADNLLTGFPSGALAEAVTAVAQADALVVVTPVFSASYSGLFKSFFDVLDPGVLEGIPVLLAATAGTPRHSLVLEHALRPMFSYLHAVVAPVAVYAATSDFGTQEDPGGSLNQRVATAAAGFARLVSSCGTRTPRDPWEDDLSQMRGLLGGQPG